MPDNRQAKRQHPLALPSRDAPVSASLRYLLSTRVAHRNWWHTQRSWKEGRVTRLRRAKGPPRRWPPRAGSGTSRPRGPLCPTRPAPLRPAMAVRDPNHEQRSEALDPPRAPTGPVSPRPSCGGKRACDNRNRLEDGGSHPNQNRPQRGLAHGHALLAHRWILHQRVFNIGAEHIAHPRLFDATIQCLAQQSHLRRNTSLPAIV